MSTQHTPGPWTIETQFKKKHTAYESGYEFLIMAYDPSYHHVAIVDGPSNSDMLGKLEANARLIAAAPDLMAALELCIEADETENWSASHAAHNAARIVVADALGVQRVNHSHGTPEHWIECARAAIALTKGE